MKEISLPSKNLSGGQAVGPIGVTLLFAGLMLTVLKLYPGSLPTPLHSSVLRDRYSGQITIPSPQPVFIQGPSLSGSRVVWTATKGQGAGGSEADRIYVYDTKSGQTKVGVHSRFGSSGFIGGYVLSGDSLAYVDTDVAPGGIFTWEVLIAHLNSGRTERIAASANTLKSTLPPQIAFDGQHLLMLETVNRGPTQHGSIAVLFTPKTRKVSVLAQTNDVSFADPALTKDAAFWTTQIFGPRMSSTLTMFDMHRAIRSTLPVGNVSQVAASGNLLVWKSGMSDIPGHLTLYSLASKKILSSDLSHSMLATFPSIAGHLVAWTYTNGSRVQIYNIPQHRVVYTAPSDPQRYYALTSASSTAVSWLYTVSASLPSRGQTRTHGYVVIYPMS